jgi:ATP-binding cassette subfamily B protein
MREIARTLWREATPFVRVRLWGVLALVVAAAVLTALGPVALRFIVDDLTGQGKGPSESLVLPLMLYVLALWLARTSNELRNLVFARVNQRVLRTLSERVFSHLMHLPLRFHFERQTGAVSQTLDNGLEGLQLVLRHLVFTCLPVVVELGTVLVVLVRLVTWPFLLLFCGAVVCYLVTFAYSAATITKAARTASAARIEATAALTDALLNYETVKYFTAEAPVEDRVTGALGRSESAWVGFYRRYALNGLVVAGIFVGFVVAAVSYAIEEVRRGRMTLGDFVLVNMYMLQVVRPIEMIGYAMQGLSQGVAMLEKIVHLFREPTEPGLGYGTQGACGPGCLVFEDVRLSYGGARPVLDKVSFRVAAGHTLGIVGPSGSGKSTVVRVLMRLLEPESGRILVDEVPISGMALQDLRRSIAVVPQDTILFDDTVRYNIAFGRANASLEEIEEAARIAQLHEFVMTLPDRYDTLVGERGVKLSGGERQRVSIARAVLKSPRIYVFDEATSSLDSRTELEILRSLRVISRLNTTLVIAHRLSTVVHADEIVVLENGQIAERGTHHALLRRNGRYAALWKAQQNGAAA